MSNRNILVTLECFVKKDGKYLMLHRAKDKKIMPDVWMAPGGKREFNEGLFEATRREVLEETGLTITNIHIKSTGNGYLKDLDQEIHWHHLVAEYVSGKEKKKTSDGEFHWLTPDEIKKLPNILAELKYTLDHIFSDSKEVISYKVDYEKGNKMNWIEIEKP